MYIYMYVYICTYTRRRTSVDGSCYPHAFDPVFPSCWRNGFGLFCNRYEITSEMHNAITRNQSICFTPALEIMGVYVSQTLI